MVSQSTRDVWTATDTTEETDSSSLPAPRQTLHSPSFSKDDLNGRSLIRDKFKRQGLSNRLIKVMFQSWKPSSLSQYYSFLNKWITFCNKKGFNPKERHIIHGLEFLRYLLKAKYSYSALNTARSALSNVFDDPPFGEQPIVVKFMKSAYNINPSLPRYHSTWDVAVVLKALEKWSPGRFLSTKQLTCKLATLLALVTGQRIQTLEALEIDKCHFENEGVTFTISNY